MILIAVICLILIWIYILAFAMSRMNNPLGSGITEEYLNGVLDELVFESINKGECPFVFEHKCASCSCAGKCKLKGIK